MVDRSWSRAHDLVAGRKEEKKTEDVAKVCAGTLREERSIEFCLAGSSGREKAP